VKGAGLPRTSRHPICRNPGRRTARARGTALICLAVAALTLPPEAQAQRDGQPRLLLQADATRVTVGEPFNVTLTLENIDRNANEAPTVPGFGELRVQSGPVQQFRTQVDSTGRMSASQSFVWQLAAPREGEFTIQPSQMTFGGRTLVSNALKITVAGATSSAMPPSLQGTPVISAQTRDNEVNKALDGKLFLLPEISTNTPYVGQPVIARYRLLRDPRLNLSNFTEQAPEIQGALVEELQHATSFRWQPLEIDGRTYQSAEMLTQAIIPTKPGDISLDSYQMGCQLILPNGRRSRGDPFGDFFNDSMFGNPFFQPGYAVQLPTPPIALKVRALPEAGKPDRFSGTVGDFTLTANVDRTQATADELLRLSVEIKGRGAIELASPPWLNGSDFEMVDTETKVEKSKTGDSIGGSKLFEFVLRAKRSGNLTLPGIAYPVFNPWTERYETLHSEPVLLTIAPGSRPLAPVPALPASGASDMPRELNELSYLKPIEALQTGPAVVWMESPALWLALPAALALCLSGWWRRRALTRRDPAQQRRQGAWKRFERRLRAARQLAGDDSRQLAGPLEAAARDCIADYFNLSAEGLTRQEIERLLRQRAMPAERVARICDLLDQCAALRYAPVAEAGAADTAGWGDEMMRLLKEGLA
jgi:hypothetical protein